MVSAATLNRRVLVLSSIALFGVIFGCFVLFEVPGLGLGHFFYIPVVLLGLAAGWRAGLAGGTVASALYALAILITPRLPVRDVLTAATAIRFVTYSSVGVVIGWFANRHREHIEQLSELAERDFLTGLLNARMFDEALARRCASGHPFALVLADVDDLKLVNDAHGHAEGNRTIRRVAEVLVAFAAPDDELARIGGDEFGILTDGDPHAVSTVLKQRLAREGLDVSFGWSARPADGEGAVELFRKADDRLYAAKLIARNARVVTSLSATTRR